MSHIEEFRERMRSAGIEPPEEIEADGKLHRFATNDKPGDDAGWYILHDDGIPAGAFGDWRSGSRSSYLGRPERRLTIAAQDARARQLRIARKQDEDERMRAHAHARRRAERIWNTAEETTDHPYLRAKGIGTHGTRRYGDALVVPMRDVRRELHSLQFIAPDGGKRYLAGGRVAGCLYLLGSPDATGTIFIAEGFATAASIREATRDVVAIAFDAGNLESVARFFRMRLPDARLVIAGDNDESGVGEKMGRKAALAASASFVMPQRIGHDWNDVYRERGAQGIIRSLGAQR